MRRLVVLLVVLAGLAVIADRVSCRLAEHRLASSIQTSQRLTSQPTVQIDGFPFLTQAWRARFDEIDVDARNLTPRAGIRVDELRTQLFGVHVPRSELLAGRVNRAVVDRAEATGRISFAALDAAAAAQLDRQVSVRFGRAGNDQISFDGKITTSLGQATLHGAATLRLSGNQITISVPAASLTGLPAPLRDQAADLLSVSWQLPPLPFGFRARSLAVQADGIAIRAQAEHATLSTAGT